MITAIIMRLTAPLNIKALGGVLFIIGAISGIIIDVCLAKLAVQVAF